MLFFDIFQVKQVLLMLRDLALMLFDLQMVLSHVLLYIFIFFPDFRELVLEEAWQFFHRVSGGRFNRERFHFIYDFSAILSLEHSIDVANHFLFNFFGFLGQHLHREGNGYWKLGSLHIYRFRARGLPCQLGRSWEGGSIGGVWSQPRLGHRKDPFLGTAPFEYRGVQEVFWRVRFRRGWAWLGLILSFTNSFFGLQTWSPLSLWWAMRTYSCYLCQVLRCRQLSTSEWAWPCARRHLMVRARSSTYRPQLSYHRLI